MSICPDHEPEGMDFRPMGAFAKAIRLDALRMVHQANASHIGGALSMADLLAALYGPGGFLQGAPNDPDRDRFILSKGHACTALYAALARWGFLDPAELDTYGKPGTRLLSHASHRVPGVELSTGSLGHGLPVACGLALGARLHQSTWRTVVLLSDGEMDEGSNWEACLFAAHHRLENLVAIIDANGSQGFGSTDRVLNLEPLGDKLRAFGWAVREVNGHDLSALTSALTEPAPGQPRMVLARTLKGKGVSFMERQLAWHYKSPNDAQYEQAVKELESGRHA